MLLIDKQTQILKISPATIDDATAPSACKRHHGPSCQSVCTCAVNSFIEAKTSPLPATSNTQIITAFYVKLFFFDTWISASPLRPHAAMPTELEEASLDLMSLRYDEVKSSSNDFKNTEKQYINK